MTKRTIRSPQAMTAIAAILAASSTPVLAQEAPIGDPAQPQIVIDPVAAPPPPIESQAPVEVSEPVVQAVPVAAPSSEAMPEPAPAAAVPAAASRQPRGTSVSPSQSAAPAGNIASMPLPAAPIEAAMPSDLPIAATAPAAAPLAADLPPADAPDSDAGLIAGLLGLAAAGGIGAFALTRRRRPQSGARPHAAGVPPRTERDAVVTPSGVAAAAMASPLGARAGTLAAITGGPLPTGAAWSDLFQRMVRQAPDAANPYVSRKRRRLQAKRLLARHADQLRADSTRPFDFRAYKPSAVLAQEERIGQTVIVPS